MVGTMLGRGSKGGAWPGASWLQLQQASIDIHDGCYAVERSSPDDRLQLLLLLKAIELGARRSAYGGERQTAEGDASNHDVCTEVRESAG